MKKNYNHLTKEFKGKYKLKSNKKKQIENN